MEPGTEGVLGKGHQGTFQGHWEGWGRKPEEDREAGKVKVGDTVQSPRWEGVS